MRELAEQALLNQVAPSAALVTSNGDILYLHGRTGMYLEPSPGEAGINNILKMAREGLRRELATALHKAVSSKETVKISGLRVKTNGHFTAINLTVRPVMPRGDDATTDAPLYLVVLEESLEAVASRQSPVASNPKRNKPTTGSTSSGQTNDRRPTTDDRRLTADDHSTIAALEKELREKDEYLQSANEELETSNEELKSSNEEMQSVNEELQSTNEELETSKEELQSVNEELSTVNSELQTKVTDLSQTNNDMNNLLAGTGIATVFVDYEMRVMRFTPASTKIINLIPGDVGRPVGHILSNLVGYDRLTADVKSVLDTLLPKEMEVQTPDSNWYSMRIQPYRTVENVIEGAVISFVDITEIQQTREALRKANDLCRLAIVVRDSHDAVIVQDLHGKVLAWNPSAERIYGWSEAEALKMNIRETIAKNLREAALEKIKQLVNSNVLEPYQVKRLSKDGKTIDIMLTATALVDNAGKIYAIATTEREVK
jgi:two-component system CheB/CheR fusion protein